MTLRNGCNGWPSTWEGVKVYLFKQLKVVYLNTVDRCTRATYCPEHQIALVYIETNQANKVSHWFSLQDDLTEWAAVLFNHSGLEYPICLVILYT